MPAPRLDHAKQGKHIPGAGNFIPGRSTLTHPNSQGLLDQWAGTGQAVTDIPIGRPGSEERVDFGKIIGNHVDPETRAATATSRVIIVYDRRGSTHIIPARPIGS